MKKKIKLRDLTEEQYKTWIKNHCDFEYCDKCPFKKIYCVSTNEISWIKNKDLYSDKFLNKEVEIEIEDEPLLTKKEKEYLEGVIRPFKDRVKFVIKRGDFPFMPNCTNIEISLSRFDNKYCIKTIHLPYFEINSQYKNLKLNERYTLKQLGLFKE